MGLGKKEGLVEETARTASQEQIQRLLFSEQISWQSMIYDLINTEQLDVWDIDISLLAQKYLDKIRQLEEANFFISSKVMLAAAFLLRMKSEILLDEHLPSLDNILFGKKEEKKYTQERIELADDIPQLVIRTPLPRYRRVTLDELMQALGKAINTETRRIKRIVVARQQEFETAIAMPKTRINLQERIREVYSQLRNIFERRVSRLAFSEFAGSDQMQRVTTFIPLLHLDTQQKILLEQEGHFEEIWIWLKHVYEQQHVVELELMRKEAESAVKELTEEEKRRAEEVEEKYNDLLGIES